jgi:hypothetical protein
MKISPLLCGVGLGTVLAVSPAIAGNRNFTLINDTRSIIDGVWISMSGDNIWHATTGFEPIFPGGSVPSEYIYRILDQSSGIKDLTFVNLIGLKCGTITLINITTLLTTE